MTRATLKGDRTSRQDFRQKNFFMIFSEMTLIGVILCEKSIARIEKFWKNFPGVKKWKKLRQN